MLTLKDRNELKNQWGDPEQITGATSTNNGTELNNMKSEKLALQLEIENMQQLYQQYLNK